MATPIQQRPERVGTLQSLRAALSSRRIGAVTLQSFASGLPLGLVWIALPAWLTYRGVDIKTVGLFSLAQAPWTFKFLWAPLMDRYSPGFLGRKRSWMIISQLFLIVGIGALAFRANSPQVGWVSVIALFIAFWSATQDIAIDGYAVEVLERSEQGMAVGARNALARGAILIAGALAITVGERIGWGLVFVFLALLYLPLMAVVVWSPEPAAVPQSPRSLREAVFQPLVDIFKRSKAVQIVCFLLLYKFGENLATALTRPFLIRKCFAPEDVGLATATIGLVAIISGAFFGARMTDRIGLGRALWVFGILQAVGFLGYIAIDRMTPGDPCAAGMRASPLLVQPFVNRITMYVAVGVENVCQGMATGAFGVLLLRMTQRQFSATQYALFSSIFAVPRIVAGPPAGFLADAIGWSNFFIVSTVASIPGLVLLQRFVPFGSREPILEEEARVERRPVSRKTLVGMSLLWGVLGAFLAGVLSALLIALKAVRGRHGARIDLGGALLQLFRPVTASDWMLIGALGTVGVLCAGAAAAYLVARYGVRPRATER